MDDIFNIVLGSVIPAVGGYLWARYKSYKEVKAQEKQEYELIKRGLQSLLRDRMLQAYYNHKQMGYASSDDKGAPAPMNAASAGLGNNCLMDTVYKELMLLPNENGD